MRRLLHQHAPMTGSGRPFQHANCTHLKKAIHWPQQLNEPKDLVRQLQNLTPKDKCISTSKLQLVKSPLAAKVIVQTVGGWSYCVANVLNKSHAYNLEILINELDKTEQYLSQNDESNIKGKSPNASTLTTASPLLTYSNHTSCIDDPIMWGATLPFNYYSKHFNSLRWSPAASEICFGKPWHSDFFALGKSFPIVRGAGLQQPAMDYAISLLKCNQWLHFFPEGRVMRDKNGEPLDNIRDYGYKFRWGISKIIMDYLAYKSTHDADSSLTFGKEYKKIRILPIYHLGLDSVLPIGFPYLPRINKRITIYISPTVIELNSSSLREIVENQPIRDNQKKPESLSIDDFERIKLTNYLEDQMDKLVKPANHLHLAKS